MASFESPGAEAGFTSERRQQLLDHRLEIVRRIEEFESLPVAASEDDHETAELNRAHVYEEYGQISDSYRDELPIVGLLRNPLNGNVVHLSLDHHGLDGIYWNADEPVRPVLEIRDGLFALTGAIALGPLEETDHTVLPGPSRPFVVPRLFDVDDMRAVLGSVQIGGHVGYVVGYFSESADGRIPRVDTWGTRMVEYIDSSGEYAWQERPLDSEELDGDLRPWIESGRLLWISETDEALNLRDDVNGCPYLDVPGDLTPQQLTEGRLL